MSVKCNDAFPRIPTRFKRLGERFRVDLNVVDPGTPRKDCVISHPIQLKIRKKKTCLIASGNPLENVTHPFSHSAVFSKYPEYAEHLLSLLDEGGKLGKNPLLTEAYPGINLDVLYFMLDILYLNGERECQNQESFPAII